MLVPLRPSMEERKEANELRELNNSQDHGEFKEHNKKSDSRVALGTQPLFHPFAIKKIIVIGAGVAGLQAARHLLRAGFQVMVLESGPDVGGVWRGSYAGFELQAPWEMYQFPDFPYPEDLRPDTRHPTGKQVHAYVKAYARHFDLYKVLHFNCKLLHLKELEGSMQRRWTAVYHNTVQDKQFKVNADYAVISTGICSEPFIPDIPRSELFQGVKIHSMDFADVSIAKGRHVIIVGAGKTAADCVGEVAVTKLAASVTMLYRQVHWPVPRVLGSRSIHSILCTRAISLTLPPYYSKSSVTQKLAAPTRPFKRLFWAAAERLITEQFSLEDSLKPVLSLPADLFYNGQILNNTIDKMISEKEVTTIRGEINCFVPNGVFLKDGTFLNADLVLFCTGYKKTYDFLPGSVRSRLEVQTDGIYLYRNIIPPNVPNLAFIGSEVSTYNNILTHGLQAIWLASVLCGETVLPEPYAMQDQTQAVMMWRRSIMPTQRGRSSVLMLYQQDYHDELLKDMGERHKRKSKFNWFKENFGKYTAADYADLFRDNDGDKDQALKSIEASSICPKDLNVGVATDIDLMSSQQLRANLYAFSQHTSSNTNSSTVRCSEGPRADKHNSEDGPTMTADSFRAIAETPASTSNISF